MFQPASANLKIGDKAPDFTLLDQSGHKVSLSDFHNKKIVVLYFYPKDETLICTKEACAFRDSYTDFTDLNCCVIGISSDSVESHKSFANNHKLPFILLSDDKSAIRKKYAIPNTAMVLPGRVTFVIDKQGIVRLIFNSQLDSDKHMSEALKVVKDLSK